MENDPDLQLFGQVPSLLATKDDTSRFVGLTILRTILDSKQEVRENEKAIQKIWCEIPKPFLVRLLKSTPSGKVTIEAAKDLKQLAVGIIHTFLCMLIPEIDELETDEVSPLSGLLIKVLPSLEAPQRMLAWQVIQRIANSRIHNEFFLEDDFTPEFWELIRDDERALEEALKFFRLSRLTWAQEKDDEIILSQIETWNETINELLQKNKTHLPPVVEMLSTVLSTGFLEEEEIKPWLPQVISEIKKHLVSRPTSQLIRSSITVSATLLHILPPSANFPSVLFLSSQSEISSPSKIEKDDIAFAKLFPSLLITELRSSFPSLMTSLNQPSYPMTSLHLSRSLDLLTAFISVLINNDLEDEDEDEDINETGGKSVPNIHLYYDANSLLRFRSDLTEVLSLSIEFLRDRYDSAKGGTRGLHPDMHAPTAKIAADAKTGPLPIAWDSSTLPIQNDPLIPATLRALAFWLSEDDGSSVTQLTIGVLDIMVELFDESNRNGSESGIDYRNEIILVLEALFEADVAEAMVEEDDENDEKARDGNWIINEFLGLNGWDVLSRSIELGEIRQRPNTHREWSLVRVMMLILNSEAVFSSREAWMNLVRIAASRARDPFYTSRVQSHKHDLTRDDTQTLQDEVAVYLLAVSLVLRAPNRKKVLYLGDLKVIEVRVKEILDMIKDEIGLDDLNEDLEEVMGGMEELGVN